jgi:hypothetical protein
VHIQPAVLGLTEEARRHKEAEGNRNDQIDRLTIGSRHLRRGSTMNRVWIYPQYYEDEDIIPATQ